MKIQLKGELHPELRQLGLKPGQIIENAQSAPKPNTDQLYFFYGDWTCVVWPENYDIVPPTSAPRMPSGTK